MKKVTIILFSCLLALLCACNSKSTNSSPQESNTGEATTNESIPDTMDSSSIGSDNESSDTNNKEYTFGDEVKITTEEGSYVITIIGLSNVDWVIEKPDMRIVTIHAEVENIDYSGLYDNSLSTYEIGSRKVKLLDDEGFELEFYDISGGEDGQYEVGADVEIGSKKRVSLPYFVSKDSNSFKIKVDDLFTAIVSPDNTIASESSESIETQKIEEANSFLNEDKNRFIFSVNDFGQNMEKYTDEYKETVPLGYTFNTVLSSTNTLVLSAIGNENAIDFKLAFSDDNGQGINDANKTGIAGMMGYFSDESKLANKEVAVLLIALVKSCDPSLSDAEVTSLVSGLISQVKESSTLSGNTVENDIHYSLLLDGTELYIVVAPINSSVNNTITSN